jgi:hypothetical protein
MTNHKRPSTFRNGLGEALRSFSWTVSSKYCNCTVQQEQCYLLGLSRILGRKFNEHYYKNVGMETMRGTHALKVIKRFLEFSGEIGYSS